MISIKTDVVGKMEDPNPILLQSPSEFKHSSIRDKVNYPNLRKYKNKLTNGTMNEGKPLYAERAEQGIIRSALFSLTER